MRVRFVVQDFEVFELVVENAFGTTLDCQPGQRQWLALQLFVGLLEVVAVKVAIAARPDEIADTEVRMLSEHMGQKRVGSNIERHAEENIAAALIQLA